MILLLFALLQSPSASLEIQLTTSDGHTIQGGNAKVSWFTWTAGNSDFEDLTITKGQIKLEIRPEAAHFWVAIEVPGYAPAGFQCSEWLAGINQISLQLSPNYVDAAGPMVRVRGKRLKMTKVLDHFELDLPSDESEVTYMFLDSCNQIIPTQDSDQNPLPYRKIQTENGVAHFVFDPNTEILASSCQKTTLTNLKGMELCAAEFKYLAELLALPGIMDEEEFSSATAKLRLKEGLAAIEKDLLTVKDRLRRCRVAALLRSRMPTSVRSEFESTFLCVNDLLVLEKEAPETLFEDEKLFLTFCIAKWGMDFRKETGDLTPAVDFFLQYEPNLAPPAVAHIGYKLAYYAVLWGQTELCQKVYYRMKPRCTGLIYYQYAERMLDNPSQLGKPLELGTLTPRRGQPSALQDWNGKYVVLDLWATWCSGCVEDLPKMENFAQKIDPAWGRFEMVCVDKKGEELAKFLKRKNVQANHWAAELEEDEIFERNGFRGMPTLVVLDPQGNVALMCLNFGPDFILEKLREKFGDTPLVKNL